MRISAVLAVVLWGWGCGGNDGGSATMVGSCADHPLQTGIVAQQTGVSADSFDCEILTASAKYAEPDPMLFKAVIYGESRFDYKAAGCPNLPCGQPMGWTTAEAGCLGLMQVVPACGGTPSSIGLLPSGHPNMTTDMSASGWDGSIFNPKNNVEIGIAGLAGNRTEVEKLYPGCSVDQYTLMALSNYANHGSAKGCTTINHSYVDSVITTYKMYATAAGYTPHNY